MRAGHWGLVIILIFSSCKKSPPNDILPAATESGEHTLGFLSNGSIWVPYDRGIHEKYELPLATMTNSGNLKITATRIDDDAKSRDWFCIEIEQGCYGPGIYNLSNKDCAAPFQTFYYGNSSLGSGKTYYIDTLKPHFIEVSKLDKQKQTVSGRFEFSAITEAGKKLNIQSGRFDLKYKHLKK